MFVVVRKNCDVGRFVVVREEDYDGSRFVVVREEDRDVRRFVVREEDCEWVDSIVFFFVLHGKLNINNIN